MVQDGQCRCSRCTASLLKGHFKRASYGVKDGPHACECSPTSSQDQQEVGTCAKTLHETCDMRRANGALRLSWISTAWLWRLPVWPDPENWFHRCQAKDPNSLRPICGIFLAVLYSSAGDPFRLGVDVLVVVELVRWESRLRRVLSTSSARLLCSLPG